MLMNIVHNIISSKTIIKKNNGNETQRRLVLMRFSFVYEVFYGQCHLIPIARQREALSRPLTYTLIVLCR